MSRKATCVANIILETRSTHRSRAIAALTGGTAICTMTGFAAMAQQAEPATDLGNIYIEASEVVDANRDSIVATEMSPGGKLSGDIMDIPASVSVITEREIQERNAGTIEEVLQYTSGVTSDFYGSDDRFDNFRVRGFDAYTYRDGLRLGSAFGSLRETPFAYERVEVVKGANSSLFGVSDPGGTVNYVTKRPKDYRFGEVYGTLGTDNHAEIGFDVGDNLTADDTLSYRIAGKFQDAESYYDFSQDDEKFLLVGVTWRPDQDTTLTFVADYLNSSATPSSGGHPLGTDLDRDLFLGEPDFNDRDTERTTFNVMAEHDFGGGLSFSSNLRYSDSNSDFAYTYLSGLSDAGETLASRANFANDSSDETFIADARLDYETSFGAFDSRTQVGVEYSDAASESATFFTAAPDIDWTNPVYTGAPDLEGVAPYRGSDDDTETRAAFVQQELTYADQLTATVGLRHDEFDASSTDIVSGETTSAVFEETTAQAALSYRITPEVTTYASYAESAVPAGLGVEPERGEQYELGVKYRPQWTRALFTASVFDLTKSNITRTDPLGFPTTIGEVSVRGFDAEAKAEIMDNLSLTAAYSYMEGEIVENGTAGNEGNVPAFIPEHLASVWARYTLEGNGRRGDMTFGLGLRYSGSYYFDDANSLESDSFTILDASYSYQVREDTEFAVNVSNLLDEKHVAYGAFGADWYNPGRSISATLRHTW